MSIRLLRLPDQKEWKPFTPEQLLEYIHKDVTFAQTNEKLLGIVIESLERLNERLHGVTPMVPFLWNFWAETNGTESQKTKKSKKTTHKKHKDENSISNFVTDHLRTDLKNKIIANREPEVNNHTGKDGKRIDISVEAMPLDENSQDTLSVAIEAKGCWDHGKLEVSMKTQLVEKYLIDSQHTHGIYLVYWTGDQDCKFKSIEELKNFLEKQAKELSVDSKKIKSYVLDCSIKNRDEK